MDEIEEKAKSLATFWHVGQRRKYTGEPYINHPAAVAELVRSVPHTPEMIAAAWLHDTLEDTAATPKEIESALGVEVLALVWALTDVSKPNDGNRRARKGLDRQHMRHAPAAAKTIKLADLIDNTRSIVSRDPDFARVYLREKQELLPLLVEGDSSLWAKAQALTTAGLAWVREL